MYHYVYRISNLQLNKHYYGKRSSKELPTNDIGIKYFSSSNDKEFIKDQKQNPQNYEYLVVAVCDTAEEAVELEIYLHDYYNVGVNPRFYNRSKQTAIGWDTTGVAVKGANKNKVIVKDCEGNILRVSTDDPRYLSGELVHHLKGTKMSSQGRKNVSNGHKGAKNSNAKIIDIYDYYTDTLIAQKVVARQWCLNTKYDSSRLCKTLKADRTKPHCSNSSHKERINPHHHKGIYAVLSN